MLTDYERYQLEWMIEHGHSLKELMDELTFYQNDLEATPGVNLTVLDVFDEWVDDRGFGGELFVCEQEWSEAEGRAMTAYDDFKLAAALTYENGAFYDPERGVLIASFMTDYDDPAIEVFEATTADLREITSGLTEAAIEYGQTPHELAGDNCKHIGTFRTIADLREAGYLDSELIDVSNTQSLVDAVSRLTLEDNVREWYMLAFPDDELVSGINPSLTFDDAIAAVPTGDGFYTALGETADSLLRERIFEELCDRYGYTYDEVYDSWLNELPLPSPAISQHPEKIAVAAGYRFNLVDAREASTIDLKGCGTVVTVDGHDYEVMKGATYEDSRKVDDLLDSHGDKPISDYRKRPQGMSLKQAVREAREASAKLAEENGDTDDPDGKDER